jgi:hypothetical protein
LSSPAAIADYAKKKSLISAEQQDPRVQKEREEWKRKTADVDPRCLKFLDQTNAKTTMTRLYGRAPRGQRVREFVPDGRWKSLTLMGTLGYAGDTTAFTYEGGTDVMAMLTFVEGILGLELRRGHIWFWIGWRAIWSRRWWRRSTKPERKYGTCRRTRMISTRLNKCGRR